ncbi:glycoside hydrolase family 114 protein [Athelia psychrophila]|uniref:alpha-galactosidase n=1 Tax=Athelia psychrophila TaxID=1759441 RepID=A0A165XSM8_9AGAM|nr:glycoside hydrolase family 114 protein [Fibularhizoctonia sp. CBS 109695]
MRSSIITALGVASTVTAASITKRAVTLPPVNGQADYQLGGPYTPVAAVAIVTRDHTAAPASGKYNICYINAFQTQPEDETWWKTNHSDLMLKTASGAYVEDPDWKGEFFLDTRTDATRQGIATILNGYIDSCAAAGYNGLEPDNLDTYTRSSLLTKSGNLALAKLIVDHAHSAGLAVAQKNTADLGSTGQSTAGFDFAVAEECQRYSECSSYTNVYGNNLIEIEYTDNGLKYYTAACTARGANVSIIYRDRDVVPEGQSGYVYQAC